MLSQLYWPESLVVTTKSLLEFISMRQTDFRVTLGKKTEEVVLFNCLIFRLKTELLEKGGKEYQQKCQSDRQPMACAN